MGTGDLCAVSGTDTRHRHVVACKRAETRLVSVARAVDDISAAVEGVCSAPGDESQVGGDARLC